MAARRREWEAQRRADPEEEDRGVAPASGAAHTAPSPPGEDAQPDPRSQGRGRKRKRRQLGADGGKVLQTGEIVTYDPWKPLLEELTFTIRLLSNPSLFI